MIDALSNCVNLDLTPGEQADCLPVPDLLAALPKNPGKVVVDKTYDTNTVFAAITAQQVERVIPPRSNRLSQREYDENSYDDRNKVEHCSSRFK